ncbi:MAG: glycosyltransferase [Sulfurimonas sp.]|nr:glycosyltransferase [Sulfurimonas sp.]
MILSPIVLFVYNRPHHTRQTVEALQKNELASESELFIYSDAPKNENSISKVNEVREYIKTVDGFKKVTIIEREKNWGLANSIIDGVTKIVNKYGKIIVLEDDLVTSKYFLRFMNEALEMYKDEEKVFGVTGYAYPIKTDELASTFFMKAEGCWSWATWNKSWKYFEKDTDNLIKTFDKKMIKEFNFENSIDFWSQVIHNKHGKINSWAIYWYATIFLKDGLFLYPKNSFTANIGFDGSGVHCDDSCSFDVELVEKYDIVFEQNIISSTLARQRYIEYFNPLKIPLWKRAINRLKRTFGA